MRRFQARLEGIHLSHAGLSVARISCRAEDIPRPGQALLASKHYSDEPLKTMLYPTQILPDGFVADAPPAESWSIGDLLNALGPLGTGFTPPPEADNWLLASFNSHPARLLPLIQIGLERGVACTLYSDQVPDNLPPQVEWISDFRDALPWANYIALDLSPQFLPSLRSRIGLATDERLASFTQALVTQAIPCGFGGCYACGLKGQRGWLWACTDGPVFELNRLEF